MARFGIIHHLADLLAVSLFPSFASAIISRSFRNVIEVEITRLPSRAMIVYSIRRCSLVMTSNSIEYKTPDFVLEYKNMLTLMISATKLAEMLGIKTNIRSMIWIGIENEEATFSIRKFIRSWKCHVSRLKNALIQSFNDL